jgi:hypothetical protein
MPNEHRQNYEDDKADFTLGDFSLWVEGWQFATATNPDDADWLQVRARHKTAGSTVSVAGPLIQASDLSRFLSDLVRLHESMSGEAVLQSAEPEIRIILHSRPRGKIEMVVNITPDQLAEEHLLRSEIGQSHLPQAISELKRVLKTFARRRIP